MCAVEVCALQGFVRMSGIAQQAARAPVRGSKLGENWVGPGAHPATPQVSRRALPRVA